MNRNSASHKAITRKTMEADSLMLITAAIWGTAFVAQRVGMEYIGPYTFNALRFALGGISLLPLLLYHRISRKKRPRVVAETSSSFRNLPLLQAVTTGFLAGTVLFLGSSFQQVGIVYTSAGNAGFITGLYVIIVPLFGLIFGRRPGSGVWVGATLAVAGLYFINERAGFYLGKGDLLVFASAFFFAAHVLLIGYLSPRSSALLLSIYQFFACSLLSFIVALLSEETAWRGITSAAIPILYGGIGSVGIAYTLQVVGQKHAPPAHAAIILSLESTFALIGGRLILGEAIPPIKLLGCALMLAGMLSAVTERYVRR